MDTLTRLKEIFKNVIDNDFDVDKITLETHFFNDLGMNSIGMLYMALAIENEFGITFANEDFPKFLTVKNIVEFIESK